MEKIICDAIQNRRVLNFLYNGENRTVEPYCFGRNAKGNDVLCAFQVEGFSSSGNSFGWKLYKLSEMDQLEITSNSFEEIRKGYNSNDKRMIEIYSCVTI